MKGECKISVSFCDPIPEPATKLDQFEALRVTLAGIKDWTLERSEGIAAFTQEFKKGDYMGETVNTYRLTLEQSGTFELVYDLVEDSVECLPGDRMEGKMFKWHFQVSGTWSQSDCKALLKGEAVASGECSGSWYRSPPKESYTTASGFEREMCVDIDGQLFQAAGAVADPSIVLALFKHADSNGDGVISSEELGNLMMEITPSWDGSQIGMLLAAADTNGDSKIDYAEFLAWLFHGDNRPSFYLLTLLAVQNDNIHAFKLVSPFVDMSAVIDYSMECIGYSATTEQGANTFAFTCGDVKITGQIGYDESEHGTFEGYHMPNVLGYEGKATLPAKAHAHVLKWFFAKTRRSDNKWTLADVVLHFGSKDLQQVAGL
eukprot:TRINITY_DN110467_c0_g1_i1.p1 TRINITY_DN110467_c0_g1~~TRINITY_DN110467_c0_g1_i1.p1  ORF type:complete len:375 (-),score=44.83 TRINITY_DN110467_c0_g1_i1:130-1254(-)